MLSSRVALVRKNNIFDASGYLPQNVSHTMYYCVRCTQELEAHLGI